MTKQSRRKVLKGLAVTLPAVWATPLVESVVLPAHANTSLNCGPFSTPDEAREALCDDLDLNEPDECLECQDRFKECGLQTSPACAIGS